MKKMKKVLALLLALIMVLGMGTMALAAGDTPTTGSITVKNATKGYEYKAYKIFNATYNGTKVSYKTAAANAQYLSDTVFGWSAADKDGNISVWVKDGVADADVIAWAKDNYDNFDSTGVAGAFDEANSTVTFSNLDFGYYYITSTLGATVTIDSAIPTATVYDKNTAVPTDPVKVITAIDGVTGNNLSDAHVGSVVDFKITANTTNWIDKDTIREEWTIADTVTNMFMDPETLVVKVNGAVITNYTAAGDGNGGFTLNIPLVDENKNSIYPANQGPAAGQIPIEITYSATILKDAGKTPAKNQIPGTSIEVFTYAFQVAKTDGTDPLPGAQFELWSAKGGATAAALTFIDNGDGTYTYYEKTGADDTTTVVTTLNMTTNTTISILGLDKAWSYTLKEITVPDGYNQAADITVAGSSLTKVTKDTDTSMTSTALYKETVVNKAGTELPSTGGIGTTIFYVVGGILVLAAGVVLITRRRMIKEA